MKTLHFACCALAALSLPAFGAPRPAAAATPAPAPDSSLLATIGEQNIKIAEMRQMLDGLAPAERAALQENPNLLNQLVRSAILQKAILREATSKEWEKQPEVAAQLARAREAALAESYLQSVAAVPEGFPSEAELQTAYDASKEALVVPKQYELAQIFVAVPAEGSKDTAEAKARQIARDAAKPNADFGALARVHSQDSRTASRGGMIGWLAESQLQPEVKTRVATMKKGEVSEPVAAADGWHIIQCLGVKESYTATLDEVREQLAQRLRAQRAQANREAYLAKLLQENPMSVNEIAMSRLLKKAE